MPRFFRRQYYFALRDKQQNVKLQNVKIQNVKLQNFQIQQLPINNNQYIKI
jgi:hypothetical protein